MDQVARRVRLIDGVEKVTGRLRFTADMTLPGLAHGALLLSPRAHARIARLDPGDALGLPGVIGVWWHANTPQNGYNSSIWYAGQSALADERMFPPVVRHIGDRVAVVLAETEDIARAALSRIVVEYEELPAVLSAEAALDHVGPTTDSGVPTYLNPIDDVAFVHGDLDAAFAHADHVAEVTVRTPRSHHCAIEPHACLAWPEAGGRVAIRSPCQSVFAVQAVVAQALGIDPSRLHVTKAPIGGSFGGKAEPILDPICAFLALRSERPVRLVLNRKETFTATRTRSATCGRMRIALAADGRILGRDTEILVDIGAYCTGGNYLPGSMLQRLVRLYAIPAERYRGRAVYTNTLPTGAFRGYGSPQIHAVGEIALDLALRDMGLDPVAARVRNVVAPAAREPWQGLPLGNARGADCLVRGAHAFGWTARRAERRATGRFGHSHQRMLSWRRRDIHSHAADLAEWAGRARLCAARPGMRLGHLAGPDRCRNIRAERIRDTHRSGRHRHLRLRPRHPRQPHDIYRRRGSPPSWPCACRCSDRAGGPCPERPQG